MKAPSQCKHNRLNRYLELVLNYPRVVFFIILTISAFFLFHLPRLSFTTSIYDLAIQDLPETKQYDEFKKDFGSEEIIRIVIRAENIFEPLTFKKIETLDAEANNIEGVRRVVSLPAVRRKVDVTGNLGFEKFVELLKPARLFNKNIISTDAETTVLTLVLHNDADKESVIRAVNRLIDNSDKSLSLYQIGMPLVSQALVQFTERDFFFILPISFLLIAGLLFLLFRNMSCLLLPVACVLLALLWTLGLMAFLKIPLSMTNMIVPVFLTAVGTAYCVHISAEFLNQAQSGKSSYEAVFDCFTHMAFPTFLAVITTGVGLGSLFANHITAIQEFAIFSIFGIFSLLVLVLALFPAALVCLPLPKAPKGRLLNSTLGTDLFERWIQFICRINLYHQKSVLIMIAVLIVICIAGIFRIRVETNPIDYFKTDTRISRNFHDIYQDLSGSFPLNVIMDSKNEDFFEDPDNVSKMARFQEFLETLPGIDKTISFGDYLKLVNYALNNYDPKYYALPEDPYEARFLINNFKMLLGEDILARFMDKRLSQANILLFTHISSSRDFLDVRRKILEYAARNFSEEIFWKVTGFGIVISASSHLLINGQIKSLSLTLLLIFCIMLLMFVSGKVGAVAILTNCFPIIINFGVMGWLDIKLSVATSMIASIAIGLAVDDTIHYLVRYDREFKKDLDKDRALRSTIAGVGKPILFTTITISIGFAVLLFSNFQPTSVFGLMMVITMFAALVGDLVILPALMLHIELVTAWDLLRLMPSLDGLSPGIAHELNQPLNVIKMGSEYLEMLIRKGDKIKPENLSRVVREMNQQVDRAYIIINRLTEFETKADFTKEKIDINQPIRDTLAIIEQQLKLENLTVELNLRDNMAPISAHPNRIGQVVYNLLTNACDAVKAGKDTGNSSRGRLIRITSEQKGQQIEVTVADRGIGIPETIQDRIFEPFFTTKETGKGKGLGLSICREIIKDYGGTIAVESRPGQGVKFTLLFPIS